MRPQHRKFAAEYIKNGFNGVQAVYAAGYRQTYNAACVQSSRLLRNAKVMNEILEAGEILSDDEILKEISKVAKSQVDLKGSDKMKGLELLAKHRGLIKDRIETTDTTESKAISSSIEAKISQIALNLSIPQENAAIQFFSSLSDFGSDHAKPENFGKYRPIIENYLAKPQEQPITEIGDQ
jgi:phage terminase small subunit